MVTMPAVWKELKSEFSGLSENELRSALCRATHFENAEVASLREKEKDIYGWLNSRGEKPHSVYHWLTSKHKSAYGRCYAARRAQDKWKMLISFKDLAARAFPEKDVIDLRRMVRRIARHEYGEIKELRDDEYALRDILLRLKLQPATLHVWLLRYLVPEDLVNRLDAGEINLNSVKQIYVNRERQQRAAQELRLLENARRVVLEVLA